MTSVCGILRRAGKVLLARRVMRGALAGKWEFPGGKVEPDEEPATALRREFREELSLDIGVGKVLGQSVFELAGRRIRLLAFEVLSEGEPVLGGEHIEYRWVEPSQLGEYDLPESDRLLLTRIAF